MVAVTKIDITQPPKLMPELQKLNEIDGIAEVYCVSAKRNKGVDELREALKKYLTGSEMYFEEDDVTDKSQRYLVCEIIREKVLLSCEKEIPHGIGVVINKMQWDGSTWDIDATVLVEKASHKPIVLGKQGAMIKAIGTHARESIEKCWTQACTSHFGSRSRKIGATILRYSTSWGIPIASSATANVAVYFSLLYKDTFKKAN